MKVLFENESTIIAEHTDIDNVKKLAKSKGFTLETMAILHGNGELYYFLYDPKQHPLMNQALREYLFEQSGIAKRGGWKNPASAENGKKGGRPKKQK